MIKAVVFDLDDTLHAERAYAFSGFLAVAAAFEDVLGPARESAGRMRALYNTNARSRVFNTMLARQSEVVDETLVGRMVECFRNHAPSIELYDDADRALRRLSGRYGIGLISDGPLTMQQRKIEALDLGRRVDEIMLTAQLGPGHDKPDPLAFETMTRRLGVFHSACVYVADNPSKDFIAPNQLGWDTVRIVRPEGVYRDAPTADEGHPGHTISTLDDLDVLIEHSR